MDLDLTTPAEPASPPAGAGGFIVMVESVMAEAEIPFSVVRYFLYCSLDLFLFDFGGLFLIWKSSKKGFDQIVTQHTIVHY